MWGGWFLTKHANERPPGTISGLEWIYSSSSGSHSLCEYTAPDGTRYKVDTSGAAYRLTMRPIHSHSRLVFPTYAAAMRYTREHNLSSIPSTPMVLASCAATDTQCQIALELALDSHPESGRRVLLRRWFDAIVKLRAEAPVASRAACDCALGYLATAIRLQGDPLELPPDLTVPSSPSSVADPPLGPWAARPELAPIWHRDRFLASGLAVADDTSASAAAILALTLPSGWSAHAAIAQILHGKPTGPTFESLAEKLTAFTNNPADPAAAAIVRQALQDTRCAPAPAALAFAASPEEEILSSLGMHAWDDPVGAMIQAVRDGKISLEPGPDAGFYRHRWFALETLAAPAKAPECHKLQLSADYERRWQRAFAASFTEGRSGFIKRLPITVMGYSESGPLPLEIAPHFTAEPSPIVYLRLSRAYRMAAEGIGRAGKTDFPSLAETAENLRAKSTRLLGLASIVYREVGHPIPLTEAEMAFDLTAAEKSAADWFANLESDPGISDDARTVVPLGADDVGLIRSTAVLGVRLEPVEYSWIEEPTVSSNIDPTFVSARLWLASPIPATLTSTAILPPADFRKQCEAHSEVASLCREFGQQPPQLVVRPPRRWPWLVGAVVALAAIWTACRWWLRKRWPTRLRVAAGVVLSVAGMIAIGLYYPPSWLVRWTLSQLSHIPVGLAAFSEIRLARWVDRWPDAKLRAVTLDLLRDSSPQARYGGAMLILVGSEESRINQLSEADLATLRKCISDPIPEVSDASWAILASQPSELPALIAELDRSTTLHNAPRRTGSLLRNFGDDPRAIDAIMKLSRHPSAGIRAGIAGSISRSPKCLPPELTARLLEMLQDDAESVRLAIIRRLTDRFCRYHSSRDPDPADPAVQQAFIRAAENPNATLKERVAVGRWIAEPGKLREISRRLLVEATSLTDPPQGSPGRSNSPAGIQCRLVTRWLLADGYAKANSRSYEEADAHLDKRPALLATLMRSILDHPDPAATLGILREIADSSDSDRVFAQGLLKRIERE